MKMHTKAVGGTGTCPECDMSFRPGQEHECLSDEPTKQDSRLARAREHFQKLDPDGYEDGGRYTFNEIASFAATETAALEKEVERLRTAAAETQILEARVKELEGQRDALLKAWSESWDCSRDPGHTIMNEVTERVALSKGKEEKESE